MKTLVAIKDFIIMIFIATIGILVIKCLSIEAQAMFFEKLKENLT